MDDGFESPSEEGSPRRPAASRQVVNPEWADAIQRAMQESIFNTGGNPPKSPRKASPVSMSSASTFASDRRSPRQLPGLGPIEPFPGLETFARASSPAGFDFDLESQPNPKPKPKPKSRSKPKPKSKSKPKSKPRSESVSDFSSASSSSPPPHHAGPRRHHADVEREEKLELVGRLQYYVNERGFRPFRELTADDPVEDLRYEVFRASREQDKRRNIKLMQRGLVTASTILEMAHHRWNPLGLRLDGYSKSMLLTIHDFDDIFEELHWKYCDNMSLPVEMKLFLSLISSVYFFHMSGSPPPQPAAHHPQQPPPPSASAHVNMNNMPPPTVPAPAPAGTQPRMSGPRVVPSSAAAMPPPPMMPSMDLLSGLGMVQHLMNAGAGGR